MVMGKWWFEVTIFFSFELFLAFIYIHRNLFYNLYIDFGNFHGSPKVLMKFRTAKFQ